MGMWVKRESEREGGRELGREGERDGGVLILEVFSSSDTCRDRGRTIGRYRRDWTGHEGRYKTNARHDAR